MFDMICQKCGCTFNYLAASCGTGWSWNLYRCPHCAQLYAANQPDGFIPAEVLNDKEVIVIRRNEK